MVMHYIHLYLYNQSLRLLDILFRISIQHQPSNMHFRCNLGKEVYNKRHFRRTHRYTRIRRSLRYSYMLHSTSNFGALLVTISYIIIYKVYLRFLSQSESTYIGNQGRKASVWEHPLGYRLHIPEFTVPTESIKSSQPGYALHS